MRSKVFALLISRQNDDRVIFENNSLLPRENIWPFSADCGTWPIFMLKITNEMWGVFRSLERGIYKMSNWVARLTEIKTGFKGPMAVHFSNLHLGKWKLSYECRFVRQKKEQNKGSPGELLFVCNKTLNCYSVSRECQLLIHAAKQAWTKEKTVNVKKKKSAVKIKLMNGKWYSLSWIGIETRGKITVLLALSFKAERWRLVYAVIRHLNST